MKKVWFIGRKRGASVEVRSQEFATKELAERHIAVSQERDSSDETEWFVAEVIETVKPAPVPVEILPVTIEKTEQ